MKSVLEVSNVGKVYKEYQSEWQRILKWFGLQDSTSEEHWVLQNITFHINSGESIGIIGQNGAGKSTLLKIITGTTKPTAGKIKINGHISAILELGLGFHPDLTGRENVYHCAGLMGFSKKQIDDVIKEVENFAEIDNYFDLPVRTYSSGMQARVAFSVVTAFRPDILIIDEVLSVGDTYFQHKSFERIREFQKKGTTLLIVSHNKEAILSICNRAILLDKGIIIKDDKPEDIMNLYNAIIAEKQNIKIKQIKLDTGRTQTISGTGEAKIQDIGLYNAEGKQVDIIYVGEIVELKIKCKTYKDLPELVVGFMIKDRLGQVVFGTNTHHLQSTTRDIKINTVLSYSFYFNANIGIGSYSISVALHVADTHLAGNYEWKDLALIFTVVNPEKSFFIGTAWLPVSLEVKPEKSNN